MAGISTPILEPVDLASGSEGVPAVGRCKDYAGNSFVARLIQQGNSTWVELSKQNPQGAVVTTDEFVMSDFSPGQPRKAVDVHLLVDGDDVVATVTGYNLTPGRRLHYAEEYVWRGVAAPFPGGVHPEMGAGPKMARADEGGIEPGPGGVEVDYERIKADVRVIVEAWARTTIANIIPKTKLGVEQLFDGERGSHVVYNQLVNTSYTGALGAIRDSAGAAHGDPGKPQEVK